MTSSSPLTDIRVGYLEQPLERAEEFQQTTMADLVSAAALNVIIGAQAEIKVWKFSGKWNITGSGKTVASLSEIVFGLVKPEQEVPAPGDPTPPDLLYLTLAFRKQFRGFQSMLGLGNWPQLHAELRAKGGAPLHRWEYIAAHINALGELALACNSPADARYSFITQPFRHPSIFKLAEEAALILPGGLFRSCG